ncbi:PucR family transcriptional regulator [Paenibacillus segetis]|uniref:PucR C-terminal helix-turn-helix domain-containing protein n=1 Tax=Paenibacillus segetis TaxID=1325360 RepID=A0ABQ1YT08_9BACL|nr:helix-turn-helix domain-containing protein [Paenibacillus segetis]GGH35412.1 hypothetical protein GCM10008013_41680 [Paenibacillus segetis]
MNIDTLKQQIEEVVGVPLTLSEMDIQSWHQLMEEANPVHAGYIQLNDRFLWLWQSRSSSVQLIEAEAARVTEKEAKLIMLLLTAALEGMKPALSTKRDDEIRSIQLGEWVEERIQQGELHSPVPEQLIGKYRLNGTMLPFLLSCEMGSGHSIQFSKLNKLLRSYFGGEVMLATLKEEWLILVSERLLVDLREESEEGTEAEREMLSALCQGLYELITSEWGGSGFYVSVASQLITDQQLTQTVLILRETLKLGRAFRVTEHVHLPWELQLERLVYSISDLERNRFIEESGNDTSLLHDEETVTTIETFFELDCNVSETAKRLYIHRNTLLYRLDKFKQETGLDVRSFRDAVLVQLGLLLYKVTKKV